MGNWGFSFEESQTVKPFDEPRAGANSRRPYWQMCEKLKRMSVVLSLLVLAGKSELLILLEGGQKTHNLSFSFALFL